MFLIFMFQIKATWIKTLWRWSLALGKINKSISYWFTVGQNKPSVCLLTPDSACAKVLINRDLISCQTQLLLFELLLHLHSNFFFFPQLVGRAPSSCYCLNPGKIKISVLQNFSHRSKANSCDSKSSPMTVSEIK